MRPLHKLLISLLVLAAVVASFSLGRMREFEEQTAPKISSNSPTYPSAEQLLGQKRPDFLLPDLLSRPRTISEWDGQALLINFWATWCAPCRDEIPALNTLRNEFKSAGFEVIGVALDFPDMVAEFRSQTKIDYPLLVGQVAADEVNRRYGNGAGGLPYSVFVDKNGVIRHIHDRGALNETVLRKKVRSLLENTVNTH